MEAKGNHCTFSYIGSIYQNSNIKFIFNTIGQANSGSWKSINNEKQIEVYQNIIITFRFHCIDADHKK